MRLVDGPSGRGEWHIAHTSVPCRSADDVYCLHILQQTAVDMSLISLPEATQTCIAIQHLTSAHLYLSTVQSLHVTDYWDAQEQQLHHITIWSKVGGHVCSIRVTDSHHNSKVCTHTCTQTQTHTRMHTHTQLLLHARSALLLHMCAYLTWTACCKP